ncbi:MAG: stage II sporulation protein D [Clostridia bacterium]|nr:stage II sporulation protein D [Clostridia bacterium]
MKYRIDFKRLFMVLLAVFLTVVFIKICFRSCSNKDSDNTGASPAPTVDIPLRVSFGLSGTPLATMEAEATLSTVHTDKEITVYNHRTDELVDMPLEEYLQGVVAAEMPSSFNLEALMAQAVAARTFSCYCILHRGCGSNEAADICTNSQCCQAYTDEVSDKVKEAVAATAGEVLLYDGEVIEALFHASSGGSTENSENVFSAARPYLRSVISDNELGSRQEGEVRFTLEDFAKMVNEAYPDAKLDSAKLPAMVAVESRYESGRVKSLLLGGVSITGKQARKLFSLDSAMFELMFSEDEAIFFTKGYGHGVGMSQSGANGMAESGSGYREILAHYYTGVTISEYTLPQER